MQYKPQNDYLTFSKEKYDSNTSAGMLISESDKTKIRGQIGTVTAVSDLITNILPGDRIYYDKHNSFEVIIDGNTTSVCRYRDVILVV